MLEKLKQLKQNPQFLAFKAKHPAGNAVVIVFAIILFWRGVWGLLDLYFFPGSPTLSCLLATIIGVVILYIDDFHIDNLKR